MPTVSRRAAPSARRGGRRRSRCRGGEGRRAAPALRVASEMLGHDVADIGEPDRVEFVERPEFPVRIPPLRRHPLELGDLAGDRRSLRIRAGRLCIFSSSQSVRVSDGAGYRAGPASNTPITIGWIQSWWSTVICAPKAAISTARRISAPKAETAGMSSMTAPTTSARPVSIAQPLPEPDDLEDIDSPSCVRRASDGGEEKERGKKDAEDPESDRHPRSVRSRLSDIVDLLNSRARAQTFASPPSRAKLSTKVCRNFCVVSSATFAVVVDQLILVIARRPPERREGQSSAP